MEGSGGRTRSGRRSSFAARFLFLALAVTAAPITDRPVRACDSTSCLLLTRGQSGNLRKGGFRIDLSFRYTDQSRLLQGSHSVESVLRPRVDYDHQRLLANYHGELGGHESFLQLEGAYGLGSRLTLIGSFPLITHRHYDMLHGRFQHVYTTDGHGDAFLGARYGLTSTGRTAAGLALKLPTARYRLVSSFDGGIHDPSIQPGSGSLDVVASLQSSRRLFSLDWSLSGSYQLTTTNSLDYRLGNEAIAALSASRSLVGTLEGSLLAKWAHRGRGRYLDEEVPSTGITALYLAPGLRLRVPRDIVVYTRVSLPVYVHVNESQLGPRLAVLAGLSKDF